MAGAGITHKAGDTFSFAGVRLDDNGNPVDLTGVPVDMYFERGSSVIVIPGVVSGVSAGFVTFQVDASDTKDWAPGVYAGDITFGSQPLTTGSTETYTLTVQRGYYG